MRLGEYQEAAYSTEKTAAQTDNPLMVPLLGLASEVGELLGEYKKFLRDADSHLQFQDRFTEELGDLLWYVANVATKLDLNLEDVAVRNLKKCGDRWGKKTAVEFDEGLPESERIPRQFQVDFTTVHDENDKPIMKAYCKGKVFGDDLTDNAHEADGYRFHDVFHLAFCAVLRWSPICRSLLGKKRSDKQVDEVEDGGRAKVIEEAVSALVFAYAQDYNWLEGKASVSFDLLRTIKNMTGHLEVRECSTGDWENAILQGFAVWREIKQRGGGNVVVNLDSRTLSIKK